ncbi:MAG: universal stress protein [Boseongicola sp.]|nr:universal stress protein [Boseongicola sp.]
MFTNILVAVDPSQIEQGALALKAARKLAHDSYAEITALAVLEPVPAHLSEDVAHEAKVTAADRTATALRHEIGEGSEIRVFVRHGRAAHEIIEHARETKADCIIVASHQPGLSDYFLGSTAARVVRHAPCSVIVLR